MWRAAPAQALSRLDVQGPACHHCLAKTNFGGNHVRLSDNDVMVAATLAAAVGETMTSKTAGDLVTVLEEIIDELTKRGGTGAMCAAAFKKHFPDQVHDPQHFPDR
jgi:hypothetical protein